MYLCLKAYLKICLKTKGRFKIMIMGLKRAIIIVEEATNDSTDIMHTESLGYAKELLEKGIERIK